MLVFAVIMQALLLHAVCFVYTVQLVKTSEYNCLHVAKLKWPSHNQP